MNPKTHEYSVTVEWTGNRGSGTTGYRDYSREYQLSASDKPDIPGSADPAFLGDATRWNPEEMLVGALSACHKLWYLHLCAEAGIVVLGYFDQAAGTMIENRQNARFQAVTLRPQVTISGESDPELAEQLHHAAHERCFIANSVNFPIHCEPHTLRADTK